MHSGQWAVQPGSQQKWRHSQCECAVSAQQAGSHLHVAHTVPGTASIFAAPVLQSIQHNLWLCELGRLAGTLLRKKEKAAMGSGPRCRTIRTRCRARFTARPSWRPGRPGSSATPSSGPSRGGRAPSAASASPAVGGRGDAHPVSSSPRSAGAFINDLDAGKVFGTGVTIYRRPRGAGRRGARVFCEADDPRLQTLELYRANVALIGSWAACPRSRSCAGAYSTVS